MNIQPLGKTLLLEALVEDKTTKSGFIIPDTGREKPTKGKILAVGDELDFARFPLESTVLFKQYGATEIESDGNKYLIVEVDDVLAILN